MFDIYIYVSVCLVLMENIEVQQLVLEPGCISHFHQNLFFNKHKQKIQSKKRVGNAATDAVQA